MLPECFFESSESLDILKKQIPVGSSSQKLTVVDLFSGCGGMTAGAFMAASKLGVGFEIPFASDYLKGAADVYKKNFGGYIGEYHQGDLSAFFSRPLSELNPRESTLLSQNSAPVDILMAGPPCQGHSNLNNKTRRMDPRNELYYAPIRAAELLRPGFIVIENVPSIVHSKIPVIDESKDFLRGIGYNVFEVTVDFLSFGLPQSRKRHLLLASNRSLDLSSLFLTKKGNVPLPNLRDWLHDLPVTGDPVMDRPGKMSDDNRRRVDYLFENDCYDLPNFMRPPCHKDKDHSYKSAYGRLRWDQPAQTITSGFGSIGQGRYIHPADRRTITPREAARIQGFPDWFSFSEIGKITKLRLMIANAVPPVLTYAIILRKLEMESASFLEAS